MAEMTLPSGHVILLDDEDLARVSAGSWHLHPRTNGDPYVQRYEGRTLLHRWILGVEDDPSVVVDHKNGKTLDFRKKNLRIATQAQNSANRKANSTGRKSSSYKGVVAHQKGWRARIAPKGKQICLGVFNNEEEAARAYDTAALKYFGEFARLNFGVNNDPIY